MVPKSDVSCSLAFLDRRSLKALFHAGADLRMELDVERAVVGPRRVKLGRVLVDEVSVLGSTGSTKVLHLHCEQTYTPGVTS